MAIGLTRRAGEPFEIGLARGIKQNSAASAGVKPDGCNLAGKRAQLPFRAVNRQGFGDYSSGLQRHHLLPVQLLSMRSFTRFFESIGLDRIGFDDFRRNGLLLPCCDQTATMLALPMHRGPHRRYNAMAIERVAQIERSWRMRGRFQGAGADDAGAEALFRLGLLQGALRRRLLDPSRGPIPLNRHDPALRQPDFADLDAMADLLWAATDSA